ncbi:MAG TPA: DUF6629 family protein [Flavipsychrobacter sp.]|nr:DUF6629 family protein [Flavipsychrobacter sp.]
MCFSTGASFSAGVVLSLIGAATIYSAQTTQQRIFALIPVIFSIQQFIEGILWVVIGNPAYSHWEVGAVYIFLVIAGIVWPFYIPLSVLLLENSSRRKMILLILLAMGILFGVYFVYCLTTYGASAVAEKHHIRYILHFVLANKWYFGVLYFIPAALPPLLSNIRRIRWLTLILFLSYVLSWVFYHYYIISVWCFFATIISLIVLSTILNIERASKDQMTL